MLFEVWLFTVEVFRVLQQYGSRIAHRHRKWRDYGRSRSTNNQGCWRPHQTFVMAPSVDVTESQWSEVLYGTRTSAQKDGGSVAVATDGFDKTVEKE